MEKYHIGQEILKEVKAKFPSVARPEGISHIRTHLRYRMIKETGEILGYEPMSFDQVKVMMLKLATCFSFYAES